MKICLVVGARPNFIKIAPIIREIANYKNITQILIHTGQHYDLELNEIFFKELQIPTPDEHLDVGSLPRLEQIALIQERFRDVLLKHTPDVILVVGDVNSTLACAQVAKDLNIKVAHVEAGLRSFDLTMPEELNRKETDHISDILYITEESAKKNLALESCPGTSVFVGNVMIDTLLHHLEDTNISKIHQELKLASGKFFVVTFHRPCNVDSIDALNELTIRLKIISSYLPLIWPLHPRTKNALEKFDMMSTVFTIPNLHITPPLGYLEFIALVRKSAGVITDSGGIQEETTALKVPCLTLRNSTERPCTIALGSNVLVGSDTTLLSLELNKIISGNFKQSTIPPLWDGHAAKRIVKHLSENIC